MCLCILQVLLCWIFLYCGFGDVLLAILNLFCCQFHSCNGLRFFIQILPTQLLILFPQSPVLIRIKLIQTAQLTEELHIICQHILFRIPREPHAVWVVPQPAARALNAFIIGFCSFAITRRERIGVNIVCDIQRSWVDQVLLD